MDDQPITIPRFNSYLDFDSYVRDTLLTDNLRDARKMAKRLGAVKSGQRWLRDPDGNMFLSTVYFFNEDNHEVYAFSNLMDMGVRYTEEPRVWGQDNLDSLTQWEVL